MNPRVYALSCLWCALFSSLTCAAPPSIESVWPPVGQRGTQFELKIVGAGFAGCRELAFYSTELRCVEMRVDSDYELTATVVASQRCRLGNEPFRLLGRDGYSELRTLRISPLPVVVAVAPPKSDETRVRRSRRSMVGGGFAGSDLTNNDMPSTASKRPVSEATLVPALNVSMCGILRAGSIDRYAIELKAGQRLTAEVEATRLGKELLDTVLEIVSPDGEVLVNADDNALFHQDPMASIIAPSDGRYVIQVHEANYGGSESSFYALHVGDFALPSVAYPAGGQIGTQLSIRFVGNIDSQPLVVDLPGQPEYIDTFQLFADSSDAICPTAVPFRLSEFPNVMEDAADRSNDLPDHSLCAAAAPIAFNGILETTGDVDCFAIEVGDIKVLRIEAFAGRIGSPVDSRLTIVDSNLQIVATNDDWGSHDSRIDFTPPAPGKYFISVTDKLAAGGNAHAYRIEVTELKPRLTAFLPRPERTSQLAQTIAVPQGNRVLVRVGAGRELIDSDLEGAFSDLPVGVSSSPFMIPKDRFWIPTVLSATVDAPLQGAMSQVSLIGQTNDRQIEGGFEQLVDLVAESADQLFTGVTVRRLPVAVTAPLPFSIELDSPTTPLSRNGSLALHVKAKRAEGFEEPVRIELPFLPPWVVCEPFIVIPIGESTADYILTATEQAIPRNWPLVATARVDTVSAGGNTSDIDGREVASELIELALAETPIVGQFKTLAAEQGQTVTFVCELQRTGDTPEELTATLEGLPNRVNCAKVVVGASDSQIAFEVQLADDAPLGIFSSVQCRLAGDIDGQSVSFVVAPHSKLQIAPQGKLLRGPDGNPLNPLEVLRQTAKNIE